PPDRRAPPRSRGARAERRRAVAVTVAASPQRLVSGAPHARSERLLARAWRRVNRQSAVPIAFALAALVGAGDFATKAEVRFTLLYLLPIGLASWFRGRAFSLAVAPLYTAIWCVTRLTSHPDRGAVVIAWNLFGQSGVFALFALVIARLRARLASEVHEREDAIDQLRHAERLTTVGKLAAGIAHELGTPLNVVAGRASLIASGRHV